MPDFVRAAVARAGGSGWAVRGFPRALCAQQDLYLVAPAGIEPPRFEPISLPWGDVDIYRFSSASKIEIAGWIRTVPGGSEPDRVELRVNDRMAAAIRPRRVLECDYRWSLEIDSEPIGADDVLRAVARTSGGFENLIGLGTLRTHPPGQADEAKRPD